jgi:hypothetical protein
VPSIVCATAQAAQSIRRTHIAFRMTKGNDPHFDRSYSLLSASIGRMGRIYGPDCRHNSASLPIQYAAIQMAVDLNRISAPRVWRRPACCRWLNPLPGARGTCALPRPTRKPQDQSRMVARSMPFSNRRLAWVCRRTSSDAPLGRPRCPQRRDPRATPRPRPKANKLFRSDLTVVVL